MAGYYFSVDQLGDAISRGRSRRWRGDSLRLCPRSAARAGPTTVQFLLNAMNANTAAIGQGYAEGVIQTYNTGLRIERVGLRHAEPAFNQARWAPESPQSVVRNSPSGRVLLQPAFLYNPGLVDSWFIVTGVFGLLLILNSSLVASAAMVREREAGTIEQLLMSPASTSEIIIAKITPLFFLLCMMCLLAIAVMKLAFDVPFHGSLLLVLCGRRTLHPVGYQHRDGHRHLQQVCAAGAC